MTEIPSPYYFVPLVNQVYRPTWAGQVSHDAPFSDGLRGELEIQIEAMRPIYVRNQAEKPENLERFHASSQAQPDVDAQAQFDEWTSFCKLGGKFAIPATSVKGAIRNVIKIATLGSFREGATGDRYPVRDLNLPAYQQTFVRGAKHTPIHFLSRGGWVRVEDQKWVLYRCNYQRVEQQDLADATVAAAATNPSIRRLARNAFVATSQASNSVAAKYALWHDAGMSLAIAHVAGLLINQGVRHPKADRDGTRYNLQLHYALATSIGAGTSRGQLVFTGQPSPQKHMEFIFEPPPPPRSPNAVALDDKLVREFLFVHDDSESEGWAYWKNRLLNGGEAMPVFWLENGRGGVQAFGLAQMFRLPARNALDDGIPQAHLSAGHDLADLIFGSLHGDALRGRAAFTHFEAQESPKPMDVFWTVLGSPKPTFYPNYLEQEYEPGTGRLTVRNYRTLMSDKIQLRGWKRYAVRKDWRDHDRTDSVIPPQHDYSTSQPPSFDVVTAFAPLPAKTRFTGTLRFHNLRPIELGALIWAIEWGGEELRHLLGTAKGMGLGSVRMTLLNRHACSFTTADGSGSVNLTDATKAFTDAMEAFAPGWANSDSIKELTLLANPEALSAGRIQSVLRYPKLEMGGDNEFSAAKKMNRQLNLPPLALRSYGEVTGKHERAAWSPAHAPAAGAISATGVGSLAAEVCTVEIVSGRNGKLRAKGPDGAPVVIENLVAFPQVTLGTRWQAQRTGTLSNPSWKLISQILPT